jgi:WD40 repeat protein
MLRGPMVPLAVSTEAELVATGDHFGFVSLWNLADGKHAGMLGAHPPLLQGLAFSADGRLLAAGGQARDTHIWDVESRSWLARTAAHEERVWSVAFSPDGVTLASGSRDGTVKLWNFASNLQPQQLRLPIDDTGVGFRSDQTLVVTCSNGECWTWEPTAPEPKRWPIAPGLAALPTALHDNRMVLQDAQGSLWLGGADGHASRWIERNGAAAMHLSTTADERWLAMFDLTMTTEIWDTATGRRQQRLSNVGGAFSPDGEWFIAQKGAHLVRWRQPFDGDPHEVAAMPEGLTTNAISPGGNMLGLVGGQRRFELFDIASKTTWQLIGHDLPLIVTCFSPDGRTLASGGWDGTLRLWSVAAAKEIYTLERRLNGDIRSLAFSPDGTRLAAAGREGTGGAVSLWEIEPPVDAPSER